MNLHHLSETYRGHTIPHFRFIERKRLWFTISGVVILLGIAGFIVRGGLNLSIDFEGGAQISYPLQSDATAEDISGILADNGRARRRGADRQRRHGLDPHRDPGRRCRSRCAHQ